MNPRPYSSMVLALCGLILIGMGLYFILLRPALLPEDMGYIGTDAREIRAAVPGLFDWLEKVFWVMGGYIVTAGLLTLYVAITLFRARARNVSGVVTLAGLTSVGWMAVVNFVIGSNFKWPLLTLAVLWGVALVLFWFER